jgi:hypothetical protein
MEPVLYILTGGVLGGVLVALSIGRFGWGSGAAGPAKRLEQPSPSLINMAHIPVEGLGGLGLVAMAIVVTLAQPPIRAAIGAGVVLGLLLAVVLIAMRRRRGPLPSGTDDPGAHSMLPFDVGARPSSAPRDRRGGLLSSAPSRCHALAVVTR